MLTQSPGWNSLLLNENFTESSLSGLGATGGMEGWLKSGEPGSNTL
jgi:hypothetical protein